MSVCPGDRSVPWLGSQAEYTALKYVSKINPESLAEDTPDDFEFGYVDISSVNELGRIERAERLLFGSAPSRARRVLRRGDVLVATVRTYLRAIALAAGDGEGVGQVCSTGFAVLIVVPRIQTRQ
jgi:type I restriction enzyme S subunit